MNYRGLSIFRATRPTARHVARHGRPAPSLPWGGMPAYESERGALAVMENLVVFPGSARHPPMALPTSYMRVVARTQGDGMTALHDDPDAVWSWRPLLYRLGHSDTEREGSQIELEYRRGLWEVESGKADLQDAVDAIAVALTLELRRRYGRVPPLALAPGERGFRLPKNARKRAQREYNARAEELLREFRERGDPPYVEATRSARAILREHLAPQQLLDLARRDGFYVRGRINRLYFVDVGNGFGIADPETHELTVSLCLHPEDWLPHEDVALATKLAIDAGRDSEAELLEAANPRLLPKPRATTHDRAAARLEERFRLYP